MPAVLARLGARLDRQRNRGSLRLFKTQRWVERVSDAVHFGQANAGFTQAIVDGMERQLVGKEWHRPLAVFDACKAFLLRGGNGPPVSQQSGGAIVKGSIDSECVH